MIDDLGLARALNTKGKVKEFVVTGRVFAQVLRERKLTGGGGGLRINSHYDSLSYRFVNTVHWQGMLFIHLSNDLWADVESVPAGLTYY